MPIKSNNYLVKKILFIDDSNVTGRYHMDEPPSEPVPQFVDELYPEVGGR